MSNRRWGGDCLLFIIAFAILALAATVIGCGGTGLLSDQELQSVFEDAAAGRRELSPEIIQAAERLVIQHVVMDKDPDWPCLYAGDVLATPEGVQVLLSRIDPGNTLGNWVYMKILANILLATPGHGYQSYRQGTQVRFTEDDTVKGSSRDSELFIDLSGDEALQQKALRLFRKRAEAYIAQYRKE